VPTYNFTGQVALINGAAMGVGFATARAFAEAGASVVLSDLDDHALDTAVTALSDAGHDVLGVRCDVADEAAVAAMVATAVSRYGRVDMAYNNAGMQVPRIDAADEEAANFDRVTAVNLRGVWACMKHELAQMRAQGHGAIVNCSSIGGLIGNPGLASYHATKHGVIGLTTSAALDYAARGVRVNAVCPGTIDTPMVSAMIEKGALDVELLLAATPMKRLGRPEEIAEAVLWLCSPGASYVTGVALPVDGGYVAQ
jgi:NAD(P)-dependent dehydrogenase (short-subunit alcohol dehydrogenase family)